MTYDYEHRPTSAMDDGVGGVANIYLVRDLSQQVQPSQEFLDALKNVSSSTQAVVKSVIEQGLDEVILEA